MLMEKMKSHSGEVRMKECCEKRESGLFQTYIWTVHVPKTYVFVYCTDLAGVRKECKYWRKKYPHNGMKVHRIAVVDNVDNQMKRTCIERICGILRGVSI